MSIIDFRVDHSDLFKNLSIDLNSNAIVLSSTIEDALLNTMPVYFKNYSYGGISSIDFRGTGAERTQVFWNGIPVNSPTLGSFDFSLLPSFLISEARVRFGGASLVDGAGGIGGSIQLNQNTDFNENELVFTTGMGSFSNYSGAIKSKIKLKKLLSDTRLFYQQGTNDFTFINNSKKGQPIEKRSNNELWRYAFQQSLSYTLNTSSSIDFNFLFSSIDREIPSTISSEAEGAVQVDQLFFAQFAYNKLFEKDMFLKVRSSFQNQLNAYTNVYTNANNVVNGWNNKVDWGKAFSDKIKINSSLRYDLYQVNTQGTGVVQEQQYSLFVASDIAISSFLSSSLGFRIEGRDQQLSPSMPYLGLILRLPKKTGYLKASVSRVFRFPTINERYWQPGGNLDLVPEEGWNYELTYNLEQKKEVVSWNIQVSAFYGLINDWILWYPSIENPTVWQAQNVWQVENSGIEFVSGLEWKFSPKLKMNLKFLYSFNSTQVVKSINNDLDLKGKQLILVPRNLIFIPYDLTFKSFSFGFSYRYTGHRFTDRKNTIYLDAYQLVDINLSYNLSKYNLDFTFLLNNIFNQNYQTYPGQPMPGTNFNLQLTWRII